MDAREKDNNLSQPTESELLERFGGLSVWTQGDKRAPHKPLLALIALARVQRKEPRLVTYEEIAPPLADLIAAYSPTGNVQPEFPFWYLQNDGLWEVPEREELLQSISHLKQRKHIPAKYLKQRKAVAGFPEPVFEVLQDRPELVNRIVHTLLDCHFPSSLHEDILDAVGLPWVQNTPNRRDPKFRDMIIRAYEHRCAVCGYDGRLGHSLFGLDAAHVRWHSQGGPDTADNGVALCSFHHKALDRGAFGLGDDLEILVSQEVHGGEMVSDLLLRFCGGRLREPQHAFRPPRSEYIKWHRDQVFHGPAR